MLCIRCKKNQATKTYERLKNGKKEVEYYCLSCYHYAFAESDSVSPRTSCPYCGTTAAELKKRNIAGCAHCYTTLAHTVRPMIEKMQNATTHVGVRPYEDYTNKNKNRILELQALAEKSYAEHNDRAGAFYEGEITRLISGKEEEYVWKSTSKQS